MVGLVVTFFKVSTLCLNGWAWLFSEGERGLGPSTGLPREAMAQSASSTTAALDPVELDRAAVVQASAAESVLRRRAGVSTGRRTCCGTW